MFGSNKLYTSVTAIRDIRAIRGEKYTILTAINFNNSLYAR